MRSYDYRESGKKTKKCHGGSSIYPLCPLAYRPLLCWSTSWTTAWRPTDGAHVWLIIVSASWESYYSLSVHYPQGQARHRLYTGSGENGIRVDYGICHATALRESITVIHRCLKHQTLNSIFCPNSTFSSQKLEPSGKPDTHLVNLQAIDWELIYKEIG